MNAASPRQKVTLEAIEKLIERSTSKLVTKDQFTREIGVVSKRFDSIDSELSLMNKRFDAIDGKLFEFTGRFEKIDERFEQMDERFQKIDERFDTLETTVNRIENKFTNQIDYISIYYATRIETSKLDARVGKIEKKVHVK